MQDPGEQRRERRGRMGSERERERENGEIGQELIYIGERQWVWFGKRFILGGY
ncbi:unnamed protein product [Camellia sinensis]